MNKIRIIKPFANSGYLKNSIHDVSDAQLKAIKLYNDIEVLESKPKAKVKSNK
ncbi:hypothetical protein MM239_17305 [Belliella sp. DSM 111904]|uniref:Uncharacterized protein n=1 Tax=Belliella filtrata TaxID=2923435 RepID=A0ABS9V4M1_9BACT|nr:hypothetical protein [Belliella filtrata]MCH7411159.1 hypothetical protein [Belliella filtrata]